MARRGGNILAEIGAGLGAIGDYLTQLREREIQEALLQHRLEMDRERLRQEMIRTQLEQERHRRALEKEEEARMEQEALVRNLQENAPAISRHLGIPEELLTNVLARQPRAAYNILEHMIPSRYMAERPHITSVGGNVLSIKPSTGEVQVLYRGEDPVEKQLRLAAIKEETEPIAVYDKQTGQVITGNKALLKRDPMRYIPASAASVEMREPALPRWLEKLSNPENINLQDAVARKPKTYAQLLRVRPEEIEEFYQFAAKLRDMLGVEGEEEIPGVFKPPGEGAVIKPMP